MRSLGADVRTAANGRDALDLLEQESADLVLTDLRMPPLDGHALVAAVRARPELHGPVVAVTSLDDREAPNNTLAREGFASVMRKPVRASEILNLAVGLLAAADHRDD